MVFKKDLTALTKKGSITKHRGKGGGEAMLPNRAAVNALTGDPGMNTMNNYAKATPGPDTALDTDNDGM